MWDFGVTPFYTIFHWNYDPKNCFQHNIHHQLYHFTPSNPKTNGNTNMQNTMSWKHHLFWKFLIYIYTHNRYYIGKKIKEVCVALAPFLEIGVWHCFAMPFLHLTAIRTLPASEREGEQRAHTPHLFRWLWFSRTSSMDDGSLRNHFRTGWTKLSVQDGLWWQRSLMEAMK